MAAMQSGCEEGWICTTRKVMPVTGESGNGASKRFLMFGPNQSIHCITGQVSVVPALA